MQNESYRERRRESECTYAREYQSESRHAHLALVVRAANTVNVVKSRNREKRLHHAHPSISLCHQVRLFTSHLYHLVNLPGMVSNLQVVVCGETSVFSSVVVVHFWVLETALIFVTFKWRMVLCEFNKKFEVLSDRTYCGALVCRFVCKVISAHIAVLLQQLFFRLMGKLCCTSIWIRNNWCLLWRASANLAIIYLFAWFFFPLHFWLASII